MPQRKSILGTFCAAVIVSAMLSAPAQAYNYVTRWTSTKTDGGGISRGDAITVTWSVVPDGESWSRGGPSDLIDYLDVGWGVSVANRTPDLTNRPWWAMMNRVYEQYARVSGVTMVYEPEQTAAGVDTGKSGDIRIGGVPFTWENNKGGVLADNSYPNNGDMRIDTYRGSNGVPSWWHTNNTAFFNLISHESGHGMGMGHENCAACAAIMETPLNTGIFGLQFDDINFFNRVYGDPQEKNGGNDTMATATPLGSLGTSGSAVVGADSNDYSVSEMDDDWAGIDGNSDEDWFHFSTTGRTSLDIEIKPQGPTYTNDSQGNVNYSARVDLNWKLFDANGTEIMRVDRGDAGSTERVYDVFLEAGDYYIEIDGEANLNQFYRITTAANDSLPDFNNYDSDKIYLTDKFDVGNSGNLNFQRELTGRQIHGFFDSTWSDQNNTGTGAVDINSAKMLLRTTTDGDATDDVAEAALLRNFGPQLDGGIWSFSFDLDLSGDTGYTSDNLFAFLFDDNPITGSVDPTNATMALTFGLDGTVQALKGGSLLNSGTFGLTNLDVEILVDESGGQNLMDILLNGSPFVTNTVVSMDSLARYFGFELLTDSANPSGLTTSAYIDNVLLQDVVNPATLVYDAGPWNIETSSSWNAGVSTFSQFDTVVFNDGAANKSVSVVGDPVNHRVVVSDISFDNNDVFDFSGDRIHAVGDMTKDGTGQIVFSNELDVDGTATFNAGTTILDGDGSNLHAVINGATLIVSAGLDSFSDFTINSGGTLRMGDATYGSGNLGGAVIQIAAGGTLDILDDGGTGLDANISGDGDVDVRVSSLVFSGSLSGFTGTLDLIGGDIQMSTGTADTQIDADITGSGGVIFNGAGTHTLNGNNDYAGATVVLGGTLALGNTATLTNTDISLVSAAVTLDTTGTATGGLSLGAGQTLSGTGSVLGDIEVTSGAGLAPGIMTISGSYTQASGGTMTVVASEFGVGDVAVTGAAQLDGGLHINQDSPVVLGHYYKILTADSVTGTFDHSQITGTELTLTPNTAVAVLYLDNGTDGNADIDLVRILATYEGDANGDGIVNPTDLASLTLNWLGTGQTWQGGDFNYDGTVNPTDLAAMTLNWLNSVTLVDGDSSGGGGVPEPTALALLGLGTVALMRRRR